jgi:hypothetical protein
MDVPVEKSSTLLAIYCYLLTKLLCAFPFQPAIPPFIMASTRISHLGLLRVTPAMAVGVTDHVWRLEEIVGLLA